MSRSNFLCISNVAQHSHNRVYSSVGIMGSANKPRVRRVLFQGGKKGEEVNKVLR